jgi:beta-lactam-binding protein with PASTA domain
VTLDLGSIVSDEQATLVFDLIGGDRDHGSGVQIDNVVLTLGQATVPNILGLSQSDAEAKLVKSGLLAGPITTAHSETIAEGHVIGQSPIYGTKVAPNSEVAFVLSLGSAPVSIVPSVVGLSQTAAESEIIAAGLAVGLVTTEHNEAVPAGIVIGQDPVGGVQVDPGTEVGLRVSLGAVPIVSVPDVVGLSENAARTAIESLSLVVGNVSTSESESIPAGHIISQSPSGGQDVAPGSAVDLVISLGSSNEAPEISAVPDANVDEGSTFAYTGFFTDTDSGSWTASVDYGEGDGSENLAINALAMTFDLNHVYADNGVYSGTLTITDGEGASSSIGFQVTVNNGCWCPGYAYGNHCLG